MKKTLFFLLTAVLAVSCHEEVVIPVGDDEPVGVMNAQFSTLEHTHFVYLSVSRKSRVRALTGADVRISVNGVPVATAAGIPPDYDGAWEAAYVFDAAFRPGDEIRVEAHAGAIDLSSTVVAPEAVVVSSVDTSTVRLSYMGDVDTYLQAKMVFRDLPGASFYRIQGRTVDDFEYLDEDGNPIPGYSGTVESELWLETGFDPVISEGAVKTGGTGLEELLGEENPYHCFSDRPFDGGEATVRPLVYSYGYRLEDHFGLYIPTSMQDSWDWSELADLPRKVHRRASLQVLSLDFARYHYLRAVRNLETFGTEMTFLVEPTTLPSNVEGGLGFVAVETATEIPFYESTRVLPALNGMYY